MRKTQKRRCWQLEALEERWTPAKITWTGATSTDWHTASNWSPAQVPGVNDKADIKNPNGRMPVTSSAVTIRELEMSNAGSSGLTSGHTLTIGANFTVDDRGGTTGAEVRAASSLSAGKIQINGAYTLAFECQPDTRPVNLDIPISGNNSLSWVEVRSANVNIRHNSVWDFAAFVQDATPIETYGYSLTTVLGQSVANKGLLLSRGDGVSLEVYGGEFVLQYARASDNTARIFTDEGATTANRLKVDGGAVIIESQLGSGWTEIQPRIEVLTGTMRLDAGAKLEAAFSSATQDALYVSGIYATLDMRSASEVKTPNIQNRFGTKVRAGGTLTMDSSASEVTFKFNNHLALDSAFVNFTGSGVKSRLRAYSLDIGGTTVLNVRAWKAAGSVYNDYVSVDNNVYATSADMEINVEDNSSGAITAGDELTLFYYDVWHDDNGATSWNWVDAFNVTGDLPFDAFVDDQTGSPKQWGFRVA